MADVPGSTTTTVSLAVGASYSGVLEKFGDHDWLRVNLTAGKTYRIDKFPDDIDFDIDSITFPMAVSITWSESTGGCKGTIIDVQHISKL